MIYGYIAQNLLPLESYIPSEHYALYSDLSSAALAFGTAQVANASTYVSNADVTACQGCHGTPYRKHGYREAIVGNGVATPTTQNQVVTTFTPCKACHFDDRPGGDKGWQQMVNDPLGWATGKPIGATDYPYYASLMNDTHMSHAMEFPYPQSMAICSTCHTGAKLANVTNNKFFQGTTCKSCHPLTDNSPKYPAEKTRAPALEALWAANNLGFHTGFAGYPDLSQTDCTTCHSHTKGIASELADYHPGYAAPTNYNAAIYDATAGSATFGQMYSALYGAKVDSASLSGTCSATDTKGCILDIVFEPTFTAPGTSTVAATIVPQVSASFYGYDTKDFLISRHTPGTAVNAACPDFTGKPAGCTMEYTIGKPGNTLFTEVARTDGKWEVQLDIAQWIPAAGATGTIPAEIAAGHVKKVEIAVQPNLTIGGGAVAVNAATQTFDLTAPGTNGALASVANYFQGTNAIVDVNKCNNCHDALGPTFHGGSYGGSITLCRTCHVPTSGAVTQEVQSRSLESFVHAIHSFQGFNTGSIDFTDPVAAMRYNTHIEHIFPNFTIKNCEGCHVTSSFTSSSSKLPVTYEVPDQSQSLPGLLSASATLQHGWYVLDATGTFYGGPVADRNISGVPAGIIPSFMTGPASRDCGGCHRAKFVKEDDVNGLVSFNQHTNMGGYMVDTSKTDTTWTSVTSYVYGVISHIMSLF
jgi:hypothetical protein